MGVEKQTKTTCEKQLAPIDRLNKNKIKIQHTSSAPNETDSDKDQFQKQLPRSVNTSPMNYEGAEGVHGGSPVCIQS